MQISDNIISIPWLGKFISIVAFFFALYSSYHHSHPYRHIIHSSSASITPPLPFRTISTSISTSHSLTCCWLTACCELRTLGEYHAAGECITLSFGWSMRIRVFLIDKKNIHLCAPFSLTTIRITCNMSEMIYRRKLIRIGFCYIILF